MFHYPRRVKDLPALEESDSEDDFNTPNKMAKQANKENENVNSNNAHAISAKTSNAFNNLHMYPKRSAELPALESDSEDEENIKVDNLNCAILNDSFILSPSKSEVDESSPSPKPLNVSVSKDQAKCDDANISNLSFISHFDKLALDCTKKEQQTKRSPIAKPEVALNKNEKGIMTLEKPHNSVATTNHLPSINESDAHVPGTIQRFLSDPTPQTHTKMKNIKTPFKPANVSTATTSIIGNTTTTDAQFATPQVRSLSMQRRPRELCSTQTQKTRSAIVNEFRSQKVLFQTPMAVSRPPMACLPNDSIALSLCDTISESGTPTTAEKTPNQPNNVKSDAVASKSQKSLESAFNESNKKPIEGAKPPTTASQPTAKVPKNKFDTPVPAVAATKSKDAVININNNDYAIIKKLGCGGSSSVYLAQRKDNGKECALKVVDLQGDATVVQGYLNETELLAKLQGNICVVALYEYQLLRKESKLFLVMEKGDSDLNKILQSYTTSLPLYVLMNFLYQMLQAVNYIHQNGVIHSDLKPANFLMINGRLKLIDFGIASNITNDSTSIIKFSQAGTFNYISPEALTDISTGSSPMRNNQPKIKISTKSDVWSLGCILYLLLYKKTPFNHIKNIGAKMNAISNPKHNIDYPALEIYYPVMLLHMVKNCLQHNPKARPSCAELLQNPFNMIIPIQNLAVPQQK